MTIFLRFFIIFLFTSFGYAQGNSENLLVKWNNASLDHSIRADAYRKYIYDDYIGNKTDSAYAMTLNLLDFTKRHKLSKQRADALILLSDIERMFGNNDKSTKCLNESLTLYKALNDKKGIAMAINGLGVSYRRIYKLDEAKEYFERSLEISEEVGDTLLISKALVNIGNIYLWRYKNDEALKYYEKSRVFAIASKDKFQEALITINVAAALSQKKEYELSKKEIKKALSIGEEIENYNILANAYRNISQIYYNKKMPDSLLVSANKMLNYAEKISLTKEIDGAYFFLFHAYKLKKDFDNTIKYYDLRKQQRTTIDDITSSNTLERIKIDKQRAQDSLVNVTHTLKSEMLYQKQKSNLIMGWGGSLSALSIFAFLIFRNTKRKQQKAERERQEQIEEKEKILKDLEISTIDAMVKGQEKERERLAADLHDSVGATLAAAKLQFDYLVKNQLNTEQSEELVKKTSTLLEEAYVEIRSMAHVKNSGVMAKNGLLPAVEKLSSNASGINGLTIEVQSFGLEQRLDNSLEISIFRIIQELVTNIIKHANATKGYVHLTNHDENLNIMIEDNGVGFDPKQINLKNDGMGINSIDRRVEHLEGTLTIESEKNKGTTVIIDIPL
ncbi:tetratricopeptide repeat-containing sensor histidine kinase [Winogradskyella forsetii]|uniref:tetratricopeptide repeat-containing sensor histidine kinase n=1 Tax=Winogradskyella forsetii TaxID=2686077 RepID=UPI0015BC45A6|nr:tetratricopeptide repeat protein [Winogradskyella forsetii]